jgi:hypothetical protein
MLQNAPIYREVKGCTREDKIKNKIISDESKMYSIKDKFDETRTKWRKHIARTEDRPLKTTINYKPRGRKLQGRPQKRCFP